jgi:hypothetical protein
MSSCGARRTAWQWASVVVSLLLGVVLVTMAGPRLVAAVLDGPADRVLFYLQRGANVTDEALRGLIAARRSAIVWHETAQGHRDVAEAELHLAYRSQDAGSFVEAERAVRQSLSIAPVDPHSWARLAHIAWRRDQDAHTASAALRASVQVGPYEPTLTPWRVRLILRLWDAVSAANRLAFAAQIRQLAQDEPSTLAELAADPKSARILDEALRILDRKEM